MKNTISFIFSVIFTLSCACQKSNSDSKLEPKPELKPEPEFKYEWDKFDVPVSAGIGKIWELQSQSDEFKYDAPAGNLGDKFAEKWTDFYHNSWTGPKPTIWQKDHVWVKDGILMLKTTRPTDVEMVKVNDGNKTIEMPGTYAACITSKKRVSYPAYVEAYAKLAKNTMASDVWMLSPDDTQEIDIIEAYGGDRDKHGDRKFYGADRLHLSHHVFIREPFQDYQPQDEGSWYTDRKGTLWRDDYHRVGVYWRDPFHLEYYVDGNLVRIVSGEVKIDPKGFTSGTGLNKELDIIINNEDQSWRAVGGLSPTKEELSIEEDNIFKVDWIRVYQAVEKK